MVGESDEKLEGGDRCGTVLVPALDMCMCASKSLVTIFRGNARGNA